MAITQIRVRKLEDTGSLKAVATVTLDDSFAIHGIKVIEGDKGLFLSMPARKDKNGEYRDIFHPVTSEARAELQKKILDEYEKADLTAD